jgi:hypothetical protein
MENELEEGEISPVVEIITPPPVEQGNQEEGEDEKERDDQNETPNLIYPCQQEEEKEKQEVEMEMKMGEQGEEIEQRETPLDHPLRFGEELKTSSPYPIQQQTNKRKRKNEIYVPCYHSIVEAETNHDWFLINPKFSTANSFSQGNIRKYTPENAANLLGKALYDTCKDIYGIDTTVRTARCIYDSKLSRFMIQYGFIKLNEYVDVVKRMKACNLRTVIEYVHVKHPVIYTGLSLLLGVVIFIFIYKLVMFTRASLCQASSSAIVAVAAATATAATAATSSSSSLERIKLTQSGPVIEPKIIEEEEKEKKISEENPKPFILEMS